MAELRWILHDAGGKDMRSTEAFSSKDEAEAWMGAEWAGLLEEGAEFVSLVDDTGAVYYKMGLRAE